MKKLTKHYKLIKYEYYGVMILMALIIFTIVPGIKKYSKDGTGTNLISVYVNGTLVGTLDDPSKVDSYLIEARKKLAKENKGLVLTNSDVVMRGSTEIFGSVDSDDTFINNIYEVYKQGAVKTKESAYEVKINTFTVNLKTADEVVKLLEKEVRSKMPGSEIILSKEEKEQIAKIRENGLSEYQERSLDMLESETYYHQTVYEADIEIKTENQIISATELERLKSHAVIDAEKQADAIMDAASDEIVSMLVDEAKTHIDDEAEEKKEQAKAEKEKQEEAQEKIDAAKARRKESEELTEEILDGVQEASHKATDVNQAQQEIKDMMNKMKLIEDDIKGAAVDKSL